MIKRRVHDAGHAIGDRDAGQVCAPAERIVPDAGDAVGDCDAGQLGVAVECKVSDAAHGQEVDRAGNAHLPAGTGVSRDGNRAVIGRVSVRHRRVPQHGRMTIKCWSPTRGPR